MLQRHGRPSSRARPLHTDNQGGGREGCELPQTAGETVPRLQDQVPVAEANPAQESHAAVQRPQAAHLLPVNDGVFVLRRYTILQEIKGLST